MLGLHTEPLTLLAMEHCDASPPWRSEEKCLKCWENIVFVTIAVDVIYNMCSYG